jgi:hypothetical protein
VRVVGEKDPSGKLVSCNIGSFTKLEFLRCMVVSPVRGGIIWPRATALGRMAPTPFSFPLPRQAGEGEGGEGCNQDPRLSPWAKLCRPSADGLTHTAHFGYKAPERVQCPRSVKGSRQ